MITSGFFDSLDSDRLYSAAQMTEYFDGLVSDGVYENVGQALVVTANSGMTVNVGSGRAIIDCRWMRNDAVLSVDITAANASLPRWTAVIVQLSYTDRVMTITTKDGTAASSPTQPSMSDTEDVKEICLAMVYVGANVTSISQSNITDTRASSLCGWVTGLVDQVDTSTLFLQWQDAYQTFYDEMRSGFDTWFSALTQELSVNTFVQSYRQDTTLTTNSQTVTFNPTGYTYDASDIFQVYVNGLLAIQGTDYGTITGSTTASIPTYAEAGSVVSIIAFKSVIGFYLVGTSDGDALVTSDNEYITP